MDVFAAIFILKTRQSERANVLRRRIRTGAMNFTTNRLTFRVKNHDSSPRAPAYLWVLFIRRRPRTLTANRRQKSRIGTCTSFASIRAHWRARQPRIDSVSSLQIKLHLILPPGQPASNELDVANIGTSSFDSVASRLLTAPKPQTQFESPVPCRREYQNAGSLCEKLD